MDPALEVETEGGTVAGHRVGVRDTVVGDEAGDLAGPESPEAQQRQRDGQDESTADG